MTMRRFNFVAAFISLLAGAAFGQNAAPAVDKGDSVWMIVATALVLLMTPALALFYGGMVQKKNVLNTMLLSFAMMSVVSLSWVLIGYSLAFGKSSNGTIGSLEYLWGQNISLDTPFGTQTIPAALFMLFQMKFAIITPALISGAVAERIRFKAYLVFMLIWSILIYVPVACWVWNGDGWLFKMGALDFAGGTVVHLASGASALALCLVLGKRSAQVFAPNNITLTLLGAGLLWFGWFGFNAGSSLALNSIGINAFLTTHLAAASAMLVWMILEFNKRGKASAIGGASGLVAGLVAITPASGYVGILPAIAIGAVAAGACYYGIELKHKFGYDDALDVVGIHGVGGTVGALLTGVFASASINPAVAESLKHGRMGLIGVQALSVVSIGAFAFLGSWGLARLIGMFIRLRSSERTEDRGLDIAYHGETGYHLPHEVAASIN